MRAIPVASIIRLEESQARGGNARVGAAIGAGLGLLLGITAVAGQDVDEHADLGGGSAGGAVVAPIAMLACGAIGAVVGSAIRTERWEEIPTQYLQSQ